MTIFYIPKNSTKTDWEVELGIIVGKEATYLNSTTNPKILSLVFVSLMMFLKELSN